jgi:hypothetical protein
MMEVYVLQSHLEFSENVRRDRQPVNSRRREREQAVLPLNLFGAKPCEDI